MPDRFEAIQASPSIRTFRTYRVRPPNISVYNQKCVRRPVGLTAENLLRAYTVIANNGSVEILRGL